VSDNQPTGANPTQPTPEGSPTDLVKVKSRFGGYRVTPRFMTLGGSNLPAVTGTARAVDGTRVATGPISAGTVVAFVLAFLLPLVGAILGHVALGRIKRRAQGGRGLAIAAIVIGYLLTFVLLVVILFSVLFLFLASHGGTTSFHVYTSG
jgi:Domain of unknown function (DUF4190)